MTIRKIIQEEIEDFDWIRGVSSFDIYTPFVILYRNRQENKEAQDFLFAQGIGWDFRDNEDKFKYILHNNKHGVLYHQDENTSFHGQSSFDGYTEYSGLDAKMDFPNHTFYKWDSDKNEPVKLEDDGY